MTTTSDPLLALNEATLREAATKDANPPWDAVIGPRGALALVGELDRLRSEVAMKQERIDMLLEAIVRITRETPYPEEVEQNRGRVARLIAEVGTLKAHIAELTPRLPGRMTAAALAESWADSYSPLGARLEDAKTVGEASNVRVASILRNLAFAIRHHHRPADRRPTHRCRVCGALWTANPPPGSWILCSPVEAMGECCFSDNVKMGSHLEPYPKAP